MEIKGLQKEEGGSNEGGNITKGMIENKNAIKRREA